MRRVATRYLAAPRATAPAVGGLLRQALGPHASVDSPASGSGPTITADWPLVRIWDGQQIRQYVDGLRTNTVAVTATGSWTIYRWVGSSLAGRD